ncbi:MAG: mercury methylation corrinoid protein HgcA [Magnetococcus sp. WYHC-3]
MRDGEDKVLAEPEAGTRPWVVGHIETAVGRVPRAATRWTSRDRLGAMAVRWGIGRSRYTVAPGLYALGNPTKHSTVLVTANYKLSFDVLRKGADGLDAWLLVLDTRGINVWCAAGKGTFGTEELVHRLSVTGVAKVVAKEAVLILPQLGAPGVAAHEVQQQTGFRVIYGPVRAADLPKFVQAGRKALPAMRRVTFTLRERLSVVPVELVQRFIPAVLIMLALFLVAGVGRNGYRLVVAEWPIIAVAVWANFLAGIVLVPALLPWVPGRSFALKGAEIGVVTGAGLWLFARHGMADGIGVGLASVAACSFLGLMFTGSTTYTSASGVHKELRWAVPLQITAALAGLGVWMFARWR